MPPNFELIIEFNNPIDAYRVSWYPGAEHLPQRRARFLAEGYFEVLLAIRSIL